MGTDKHLVFAYDDDDDDDDDDFITDCFLQQAEERPKTLWIL